MIGNRVTEKDIRDWLDQNGFVGRTAKIDDLELHAIQRPGWLQIFRFEATVLKRKADSENDSAEEYDKTFFYGAVRDDERERSHAERTKVFLFDDREARQEKLDELSEGLLQLGTNNSASLVWLSIVFIVFFLIVFLATKYFGT